MTLLPEFLFNGTNHFGELANTFLEEFDSPEIVTKLFEEHWPIMFNRSPSVFIVFSDFFPLHLKERIVALLKQFQYTETTKFKELIASDKWLARYSDVFYLGGREMYELNVYNQNTIYWIYKQQSWITPKPKQCIQALKRGKKRALHEEHDELVLDDDLVRHARSITRKKFSHHPLHELYREYVLTNTKQLALTLVPRLPLDIVNIVYQFAQP